MESVGGRFLCRIDRREVNPLKWTYDSFWMIEAVMTETGHTFTVDNIHDLPFIDAETAEQWCITWHKEFPHIKYRPVRYMRVEEGNKVN